MLRRLILLSALLLKISTIYIPGVEITVTGNTLKFNCETKNYFRKLEQLRIGLNENIRNLEIHYCLDDIYENNGNAIDFSNQTFFAFSELKHIFITTGKPLKIVWHDKTLRSLETFSFIIDMSSSHHNNHTCDSVLERIQLNEFKVLKRLELFIQGNYKENELKIIAFCNLQSLHFLEHFKVHIYGIYGKKLLDKDDFDISLQNQRRLLHLDLSGNFKHSLSRIIFPDKPKLETLILSSNRLSSFPDNINTLERLMCLDLSYNQLSSLSNLSLQSLQVFNISNNKLLTIQEKILDLPNLREFVFSNNLVSDLDDRFIKSLKTSENFKMIEVNYFCEDAFHKIEKRILNNLESLTINVKCTDIKVNVVEQFKELTSLRHLILGMDIIKFGSLSDFSQDYFHNFVRQDSPARNADIQTIIKNNLLLEVLHLKGWSGFGISNNFEHLKSLKNLELSYFVLNNAARDKLSFNNPNLEKIDLELNEIIHLTQYLLSKCSKLITINISRSSLSSIHPKAFSEQKQLEELSLRHNNLQTLPIQIFKGLRKLRSLNLEFNKIRQIAELIFVDLINIRELNLKHNQLLAFSPQILQLLPRIETIVLQSNQISELNFEEYIQTSNNTTFKTLSLKVDYNRFHFIDLEALMEAIKKTDIVYVNMNLQSSIYFCDCKMFQYYSTAKALQKMYPEITYGSCGTVDDYKEGSDFDEEDERVNILDMAEDKLKCRTSSEKGGCEYYYQNNGAQIVNCSSKMLGNVPEMPDLEANSVFIELHMENNELEDLLISNENISVIYAAHNQISKISPNNLLKNLKYLDLRFNNFTVFSQIPFKQFGELGTRANILQNNWTCSCEGWGILQELLGYSKVFTDFDILECSVEGSQYRVTALSETLLCGPKKLYWILSSFAFLLFIAICSTLFYKYNHELKVWLYSQNLLLCCISEEELDRDRIYDAFVSYAWQDERYLEEIVDRLEKCEDPYKLCIHIRDWRAGEFIQQQIIESVNKSKRTIIILTKSFVDSVWARLEFRTAAVPVLKERRPRLIIILCEDLEAIGEVDDELQAYLNTNTYLKWNDKWFWDRLRYALPHRRRGRVQFSTEIELRNA